MAVLQEGSRNIPVHRGHTQPAAKIGFGSIDDMRPKLVAVQKPRGEFWCNGPGSWRVFPSSVIKVFPLSFCFFVITPNWVDDFGKGEDMNF